MDPVAALRQIAFFKDRAGHDARRVMAYRKAADTWPPSTTRLGIGSAEPGIGARCRGSDRRRRL